MTSLAPLRSAVRLTRLLVPAAACTVATSLLPVVTSTSTVPVAAHAAVSGPAALRFGSFNVLSVGLDRWQGEQRPWKVRRATVINQILAEQVHVLGVQETNPSTAFASRLVDGRNQYLDLRNGLNKAGGHYALANAHGYNCVNPDTKYRCRYRARGASNSERILYDTRAVTKLYTGSMQYRRQGAGHAGRYLAWSWFRSKATGHKFLFTTTHLDPAHRDVRRAQWKQMISKVRSIRGGRPVVSVGDFNMQKFDTMAKEMLPAMKNAGFGDVLNQQYATNPARGVRAKRRINGWVNSNNHLTRNVADFAYEDRRDKIGNSIDWIFASNALSVPEYQLVLSYDPRTLQVTGTLPSDHNLIRATINIP